MARTRVKICGVCRVEDARLAVAAGADAVGIIRLPVAGRFVETDQARAIAQSLPAFVMPVLVYMDAPASSIYDDLQALGHHVATVQLNGSESPAYIADLRYIPVIKAVRMDSHAADTLKALRDAKLPNLVGVTLESPGQMGGSGVGNDWDLVKRLQADGAFQGLPIIAAGGLTPETVGEVVRNIRPYGVDVSSGVEARKREKSATMIEAFFQAVRDADKN